MTDPWTLVFLLLILAFVAFKWPYLGSPFYWDEAWVYAPAVKAMHAHGPSLLPNAIDPSLSRGHPVLFHMLGSIWTTAFGTSRVTMHAFALVVSVGLLILVYRCGSRVASRSVGLSAVLLLLVNEPFLAQSAILLPEVMLALLALLTAWMYVERRPWGYVIAGTCALLTKESALVLIMALVIWHIIQWVAHRESRTGEWRRWLGLLFIPVGSMCLYFLYQYRLFGWFFYPEHLGMITWGERHITYKAKLAFTDLFEAQGGSFLTYAVAFAVPVLWGGRDRRWAPVVILLYITAIKVLYGKWTLPSYWTLVIPLLCFAAVFLLFFWRTYRQAPRTLELVCIGFLFVIGFIGFCALNFFTDRYLLCAVPFIALGASILFDQALRPYHKALPTALTTVLAVIMAGHIGEQSGNGDTRLTYTDAITVHRQMIGFCEDEHLQEAVFFGSFLDRVYMTDTTAGYLSTTTTFAHIRYALSDSTQYAIYTDALPGDVLRQRESTGLVIWERFTAGTAWAELWRRPTPD